jgi:hypothetical protein
VVADELDEAADVARREIMLRLPRIDELGDARDAGIDQCLQVGGEIVESDEAVRGRPDDVRYRVEQVREGHAVCLHIARGSDPAPAPSHARLRERKHTTAATGSSRRVSGARRASPRVAFCDSRSGNTPDHGGTEPREEPRNIPSNLRVWAASLLAQGLNLPPRFEP